MYDREIMEAEPERCPFCGLVLEVRKCKLVCPAHGIIMS